jgi:hypothetical protein
MSEIVRGLPFIFSLSYAGDLWLRHAFTVAFSRLHEAELKFYPASVITHTSTVVVVFVPVDINRGPKGQSSASHHFCC